MARYLLDADTISDAIRGQGRVVLRRAPSCSFLGRRTRSGDR
jgi:hypothetical protein